MILRGVLLIVLALVVAAPAAADEPYPTRPVTIVVPFPPGGIADLSARPLAAALERAFKQPVVVTNKAGAAGAVGMQSAAIAKPDGYTLLLGLVSISTIPEVDALFAKVCRVDVEAFGLKHQLDALCRSAVVLDQKHPHLYSPVFQAVPSRSPNGTRARHSTQKRMVNSNQQISGQ